MLRNSKVVRGVAFCAKVKVDTSGFSECLGYLSRVLEVNRVSNMAERHNTVVCTFDPSSPRIMAHDIHEWIYATLRLPEQKVTMIQIDGIKRQVFIKLLDNESVHALLSETGVQA